MQKGIIVVLLCVLMSSFVLADTINVSVDHEAVQDVHIAGLDIPARYDFSIENNGEFDQFNIYNLLGHGMEPSERFSLATGASDSFELLIYPQETDVRGKYQITYYIHGLNSGNQEERIVFEILDLEDVFELRAEDVDKDASSLSVLFRNKENIDFDGLQIEFESDFYSGAELISLGAYSEERIELPIPEENIGSLLAGLYTLKADIEYEGVKGSLESELTFIEGGDIVKSEESSGFFIRKTVHRQTNEGNLVSGVSFSLDKNILSRLFTSFYPDPTSVDRNGLVVHYLWEEEILPGEGFDVQVSTNWFFPLLLIFFIVAVVVLAKRFTTKPIYIRKDISYVKVKGGEFALKVSLVVQAKSFIERVTIVDRFPSLVKLYGHFGSEKPQKVDEAGRRLQWSFGSMDRGEVRVMSYIVYSKVGVLGKFVLPPATLFYEKAGKFLEAVSNRAFFVTDQVGRE